MGDDGSHRNENVIKLIERKISDDKKDIASDIAIMGASALAIGAGVLGAAYFGGDVIKAFSSDEALTLSSLLHVKFQGMMVGVSTVAVIAGIYGVIRKSKGLVKSIRNLNFDKSYLKELEEENGRSR